MRVYDRFWTAEEIRFARDKILGLRRETTLFRCWSGPTESIAHGGVLSLKSVASGKVSYGFGKRVLATRPGRVVLAPAASRYSTRVEGEGADVVSLYFPAGLASEAFTRQARGDEALLDDPAPQAALDFPAHGRMIDGRLAGPLAALARGGSAGRLEDAALDALAGLASLAVEAAGQRSRAPAARAPVKAELFQRACLARDRIEDSPGQAVPLEDLAAAACLSPFHLHRVFRKVFGETPFEMGRRRRIERAKALLARRRTPVAEVAAATGFESESAFSRSFRAVTGMSPTAYRRSLAD